MQDTPVTFFETINWVPTTCAKGCKGLFKFTIMISDFFSALSQCSIIKNGWKKRVQCYDRNGILASFQRWYCKKHKKSFSATTKQPELQAVIAEQKATCFLLIFPRVVVT